MTIVRICDFNSQSLRMQNHCKNCNKVLSGTNSCESCGLCLGLGKRVSARKSIPNGVRKRGRPRGPRKPPKPISEAERSKRWAGQILKFGQAFCYNEDCNFVGMSMDSMETHAKSCTGEPNFNLLCCVHCRCSFSSNEDYEKHQQTCNATIRFDKLVQKKRDGIHFRVIQRLKSGESSEEHIIQPMPEFPKGVYRRRRPYSVHHAKSWVLSLEKYKYVKCLYQNCFFLAMSLEDMIIHFGYCNGDTGFAKFECPYCNGRVTSEQVLQKHIERSHQCEDDYDLLSQSEDSNDNETEVSKMEPETDASRVECETEVPRVECEMEESNGFLFTDMESLRAEEEYQRNECHEQMENKTEKKIEEKSPKKVDEFNEITKIKQTACWKIWNWEIKEFKHAFCRKPLCNFISFNVSVLELHMRNCDGTPDFEFLNCPNCRYRLPTREDLMVHIPKCKNERYPTRGREGAVSPSGDVEETDDLDDSPVFRPNEGKSLKIYSNRKANPNSALQPPPSEDAPIEVGQRTRTYSVMHLPRKRGRPRTKVDVKEEKLKRSNDVVKCAKCESFLGTRKAFVDHNARAHVGLGWVEGETPVDMEDDKLWHRLVKEAFKISKKGVCEKCDDVKRSAMGFISHFQNCGKTAEEKNALKVQCPHCEGKYMKYSFSTHLKFCRGNMEEDEENKEERNEKEETPGTSGKRRSALKAVSKFQEALSDNEEADTNRESPYTLYERGSEKMPKLNSKLSNLWYKMKRENKEIPCRHENCDHLSQDVREAKMHHYNCPLLPRKVYLCGMCDFYSVEEEAIQAHIKTHRKYSKQWKYIDEDEEIEDEAGGEDDEDEDELGEDLSDEDAEDESARKLKRKKEDELKSRRGKLASGAVNSDVENRLKQSFCKREKMDNLRGSQFYSNGLNMTLEDETSRAESLKPWEELHSTASDWMPVPSEEAHQCFPELTESVPVRFGSSEWKRFQRFEGDLIEDVPVMFAGGSVRSMSWCKVSFKRMMEKVQRQYLAVATSKNVEHFRDVHDRSLLQKSSLVQIWDCGCLENDLAKEAPRFSMGLMHEGGEIWDLAWLPEDTFTEGNENRLSRLGLLATAADDGLVRIWSIFDPELLEESEGAPVCKTEPKVVLTVDEDIEEACLRLGVGREGVLAGGFTNGDVAVWNLNNISSPICKTSGKSKKIRANLIIHAHKTAITALTVCPLNSRYISTAGLDRFVKMWDTESPSMPVDQYNKEYSLDNIWTLNWPSFIFNFDDVILNFNKGSLKFIKDIITERHQSTVLMEDSCLTLAYSDWLTTLCAGSITGEVKLRMLKNLVHDQKRSQSTVSSVRLERTERKASSEDTNDGDSKEVEESPPRSYEDVNAEFGLVFTDYLGMDKGKPRKPEAHPEAFPIKAVNKITFNPNIVSFTHIAVGYNCGIIRIQPLKELQSTRMVNFFLEKFKNKTL